MADDGIAFDGESLTRGPLGGAESAFASLALALAARGHAVTARTRCAADRTIGGVAWRRHESPLPDEADLYIANRGHRLLPLLPRARRRAFWIHNPAGYLLKPRYLWPLWRMRPTVVFSGPSHLASYPRWAPGARAVIPYGIADDFRGRAPAVKAPPPRAIFTSNPLRSLDWVLRIWAERIRPRVAGAELHVFSGPAVYGEAGAARQAAMAAVLDRAAALREAGVVLRGPVAKDALRRELESSRAMLYRGDPGETFCLAVAEAQAMGVPAVVCRIASLPERVRDGATGFVVADGDEAAFAAAAIRVLSDDTLWLAQHREALATQASFGWDDAAAAFEKLLA